MPSPRLWLRWINLLLILATLAAYTAPLFSPARGWLPALLAVFFPWLLLGNVLFVLGWALLRSRYAFFSLACLLLGWGHVRSFVGLNGSRAPAADAVTLRVGTLNAHSLVDWEDDKQWVQPERLLQLIRESRADVFCFQEFASSKAREYLTFLREHSDLTYFYGKHGSLVVVSRYPIKEAREVLFSNRSNGYQVMDILVGSQRVRLYNVHLQTNNMSQDLEEWAEEEGEVESATYLGRMRYLFRQYWQAARLRAEQAEDLALATEASPYPVVVCGDFNDVPLSWTYRRLTRRLNDGFRQRGFGLGTTYSGMLPALRIDYVLTDPALRVLDYTIGDTPFSDHKAVWCGFSLPAP